MIMSVLGSPQGDALSVTDQPTLSFSGYLGFVKNYICLQLTPTVFLRLKLIEEYLTFLKVRTTF